MLRRRRLLAGIAGIAGIVVLAVACMAVQAVVSSPDDVPVAAAAAGPSGLVDVTVRAQPGDSLWAIAEAHHGEVDLRRYLDRLIELNGGTVIEVGQLVRLP